MCIQYDLQFVGKLLHHPWRLPENKAQGLGENYESKSASYISPLVSLLPLRLSHPAQVWAAGTGRQIGLYVPANVNGVPCRCIVVSHTRDMQSIQSLRSGRDFLAASRECEISESLNTHKALPIGTWFNTKHDKLEPDNPGLPTWPSRKHNNRTMGDALGQWLRPELTGFRIPKGSRRG